MQMPIDDEILELMDEADIILSPAVISKNINKSRSQTNQRLSELVDRGLVDRPERGYYDLNDLGRRYLAGEVDADDLVAEPIDEDGAEDNDDSPPEGDEK